METVFRQGNIEVKRNQGAGRCEYGHNLSLAKYVVERNGVTEGVFGPGCVKKIERAARRGTIDRLLGTQTIADLMAQPTVTRATQYDRFPVTPHNRRAILDAAMEMTRDEYLRVPGEVEIVPADTPNFRKKGLFVYVALPTASEIDRRELTPEQAALEAIAAAPHGVYAGLKWMGKQDRTGRIFSLVSSLQGMQMYRMLAWGLTDGKLNVKDYGSQVVFEVSSFSKEGQVYKGRMSKLPVDPENAFSQAFELTTKCQCDDHIYSTMAKSDANSDGKHYVNHPVRIGKHEVAVLELAAVSKPDMVVSPQPFNFTAEFADLGWKLANRVVHGSRMLTGIEQEVLLWGATNGNYLGTEGAFATNHARAYK